MDQNLQKRIKITDRSKMRIGAIFGGIFEFGQNTQNWWLEIELHGNQKLLIPYDAGSTRWLARSSRIRGGLVGGKEEDHEEHDERMPTRYKRTPTRCYPVSPARPDPHTQ